MIMSSASDVLAVVGVIGIGVIGREPVAELVVGDTLATSLCAVNRMVNSTSASFSGYTKEGF